uniref:Sulfotransferase n=1 Tax=Gopherus evgoodei TaxID=1825980 RepID=A0A8C4Y326_9SAUR
ESDKKYFDDVKGKESEELLFSYKEVRYPIELCSAEIFQALDTIEFRQGNVFLVTYPKCGEFHRIPRLNKLKTKATLRFPVYLQAGMKIKIAPSPRLFSTHLHYDDIPKAVFEKKVKILVVFQNPKVVFFQNWGVIPLLISYFDHALSWNKHMDEENIMIITYEEMKENSPGGVKQIAKFLGFSLPEEKIQSIAENATFKSMSNKSQETHGILAPMLFRKGDIGDWKNLFTEAQSQEMDVKFKECLAGTKLGAKLKYDKYCKY